VTQNARARAELEGLERIAAARDAIDATLGMGDLPSAETVRDLVRMLGTAERWLRSVEEPAR
jgi:hypothetical protein